MSVAARLIITGQVQGVGFRVFVCHEALARGVRGWVRNRANGSVETLLIGDTDIVEAMVEVCGYGPAHARVDHVERFAAESDGSRDFTERTTV